MLSTRFDVEYHWPSGRGLSISQERERRSQATAKLRPNAKAARGHLERSGDDRRAYTAGTLPPGIFVNRRSLTVEADHANEVIA